MKEYWYLRNGDFRPEILGKDNAGYANRRIALEQLAEAGNLFYDENCAIQVSDQIRDLLRSAFLKPYQEYNRQTERHSDNNPRLSPTSPTEIQTEGSLGPSGGLQSPRQQTASHLQDDSSRANVLEIHVKVQIHS